MRTILLIILIILLVGALPLWPYSSSWGYYPSGGLAGAVDTADSGFARAHLKHWCIRGSFDQQNKGRRI
ncbi:DUF3309 domain-containing protein [Geotalea toluenoxydans]|uniref:DUF3309 domain-containing protein n=1 Tax=Geotalea toluenoxydans TaxID=421624 RepID=UPI000ABA960F|nr:DUF3309 domain-containing protein [Geotalea toluenoxydans]